MAHGTAVGLPSDADMGSSEVGLTHWDLARWWIRGARLVDIALETERRLVGR
jgi:2,3-bisphosphoglycerate-independent phosphoglycerate mutase